MKKPIICSVIFGIFFLYTSQLVCAQCNTISTYAGNATTSYGGDGGQATAAGLNTPTSLALDDAGNLYIADISNQRIRKITTGGIITTIAGTGGIGSIGDGGPATAGRFDNPQGVTVDSAGNVYVADLNNNKVRKISISGTITTVAGTGSATFSGDGGPASSATLNHPSGVKIDFLGNLYIADRYNHRVRKVSPSGIISTVAGIGTGGFSGDGGPATAAKIQNPVDVDVDTWGNLFIADLGNYAVRKVTGTGIITTVAGNATMGFSGDGGPATAAQLNTPHGIGLDTSGNLYIADWSNGRIRRVSTGGVITTVAGYGPGGFTGDGGPATAATLWFPADVAMTSSGIMYIGDGFNYRVRKVTPRNPTVSAILGAPSITVGSTTTFTDSTTGGTWSASNAAIASVDSSTGVVYGISIGIATISYSVTDSCGITVVTKNITVTTPSSVLDTKATSPSIITYPNPTTNNMVVIATHFNGNNLNISCYSLIGVLVLNKKASLDDGTTQVTLDLDNLQKGIYQVVVQDENGMRYVRSIAKE